MSAATGQNWLLVGVMSSLGRLWGFECLKWVKCMIRDGFFVGSGRNWMWFRDKVLRGSLAWVSSPTRRRA